MIDGLHFVRGHTEAFRCGRFEHQPRQRADLAHRQQIMPRAARAVGVLVAELHLVTGRLNDANARPVRFHFLRHDQRQAGANAGAHLGAVGEDRHDAVGRDRNEDLGIDHRAMRHLAGAGLIGGKRWTRQQRCGEHEAAGETQRLQDGAARDVLDLEMPLEAAARSRLCNIGICHDGHDHTPVEAR